MYHVLACGESFRNLCFEDRDKTRDNLRRRVAQCGLVYVEHHWIWDDTDRAQLLIVSREQREKAQKFKDFLEQNKIEARIITQLPRNKQETTGE